MDDPGAKPETWDGISEAYEAHVEPFLRKFARTAVGELRERAWEHRRALDVACGPGTASVLLTDAFVRVTAVDFSPQMLARCRTRTQERGVEVLHADGQALPLQDDVYDAALSMFGLIFFPNPRRGLTELRRVVRGGAPALIGCWTAPERSELVRSLAASIAPSFPELLEGGDAPPGLDDPDRIRTALTDAGFSDPEVLTVSHTMEAPTSVAMWEAFETAFYPVKLLREQHHERWAAARTVMVQRFERISGPGPCAVESTAYLGIGTA